MCQMRLCQHDGCYNVYTAAITAIPHFGHQILVIDQATSPELMGNSKVTSLPVSFLYTDPNVSNLNSVELRSLGSRYTCADQRHCKSESGTMHACFDRTQQCCIDPLALA